jgi:hypothetical protein
MLEVMLLGPVCGLLADDGLLNIRRPEVDAGVDGASMTSLSASEKRV